MSSDLLRSLDWSILGGAIAVLALTAALLTRNFASGDLPKLGLMLAVGGIAFSLSSMPGIEAAIGLWRTPLRAVAAAQTVVVWLGALALFDDRFRLKPWHVCLWGAVAALYMTKRLAPLGPASESGFDTLLTGLSLVFALMAASRILTTWRGDLVEERRRARAAIFGGIAAYCVLYATMDVYVVYGRPSVGEQLVLALVESAGLLAVAFAGAWAIVVTSRRAEAPAANKEGAGQDARPLNMSDHAVLSRLDRLMSAERLYRQDRLSIGILAAQLGLPEYRVRRLINQGLGHRNFAAFINGYRIQEAKGALGDAHQTEVPILTIALDAGFGSLGPFNRAFKSETGMTPSQFRAQALEAADPSAPRGHFG